MTMNNPSEKSPSADFHPYDLDYLPDDMIARAQCELFEDEDTRVRSLEQLRSMLLKEKDLLWQDDDLFLLAFLRARKFDVQRAFQLVKNLYTISGKYKHIYYNFLFEDIRKSIEENVFCLLPYRDSEGNILLLFRVADWNPEVNSLAEHLLCFTCGLHCAIRNPATQISGFTIILDLKNLSLKQFLECTFSNLRLIMEILQNCFPARFRGVHLLNQNYFFTYVWMVIRPMMSQKFRQRVHFHGGDMKSLYKYLHPNILPSDIGGKLTPINNDLWSKMLMESEDYLHHVFSFGYKKYLKKDRRRKENEMSEKKEWSTKSWPWKT